MNESLIKGFYNRESDQPLQDHNKENEFNNSNPDNEPSISDEPFFVMTLEFEKGKYKKIKIFPSSDPSELAYNFCKENNLDFSSLKFLTKEISILLTKYNSKQLDLFQSNNSIQEVEEEHIQTELTKSPEKNEEEKSHRSAPKFIYSSIDTNGNNDELKKKELNKSDNKEVEDKPGNNSAILKNEKTVENEEDGENKCATDDFINYKEEYYPTNDDNEDIENIKLNLKAQESKDMKEQGDKPSQVEDDRIMERPGIKKEEIDQENTRALLFNNMPTTKSIQSSSKNGENNIASKPSNSLQSNDNINDVNASSQISRKMKPHPNLANFQTEEDELAKLIEIKRKKDEKARQLQDDLENEQRENQRHKEEQLFLEEQDRIEREEYIKYEKEQALKSSTSDLQNKDLKKKKLTLNEIDYNFIEEKYPPSESKTAQKSSYKQVMVETIKSNGKSSIPVQNVDTNQHLFQYQILTEHRNSSQRTSPLSHLKNGNNNQCTTTANLHNSNTCSGTNNICLKKNNFLLLKPEMNLIRCCSANVFEKLYSEAELKRQIPKRPCHFSYRKSNPYNNKSNQPRSMSSSSSQNTHIKINSGDFVFKGKYTKTTSKTPSTSSRIQPHQRKTDSTNPNNTHSQFNQVTNKPRPRNKIIHKESNSYSTDMNILQTTNGNLKPTSGISYSQNKILTTDQNTAYKKEKETKRNTLKLITKKNLSNPLLKKKIEQIKKEFQEKYTFKPKLNKHFNCEPGISFTDKQDKCDKGNKQRNNSETNKGGFASKDIQCRTKRKDCNVFNKNYDYSSKTKTNRNSMFNKSNDHSEPFRCINDNSSVINKKKEEAFYRLFKELNNNEDGTLKGINLSTKTIPDNIVALINPLLNLIKRGITSFTVKTFISSLNVIYEKMSSKDKQTLIEHFLQKKKKEQKQPKEESTNQYKVSN